MQRFQANTSEVAILSRVLEPDQPTLSPEAAHDLLALDFGPADKDRMRDLSAKAREGTLTPAEQAEADNYERVGHLLNILQSKARRSLKVSARPITSIHVQKQTASARRSFDPPTSAVAGLLCSSSPRSGCTPRGLPGTAQQPPVRQPVQELLGRGLLPQGE